MAMTVKLASGFPPQTEDTWRSAAEAASKGAPLEKLKTKTEDGFALEPLYFRPPEGLEEERPGFSPFTRGDTASGNQIAGWGLRQPFVDADLDRSNSAILRDLERGVSEILLVADAATRRGLDPDGAGPELAGQGGLPLASVDDLDLVLAGVMEDLAPVSLETGTAGVAHAMLLIALWKRRGRALASMNGSLGVAPLSAWVTEGRLLGGPEAALSDVAALARWCAQHLPQARVARADEGPFHEAGASDAEGLGLVLAEAVETLRACAAAGHDLSVAAGQLELSVRLGSDVFAGISKLRAARLLWTRLAEVLGISSDARRPDLVARLGLRSLTRHDPFVNLLRGTAATFAAGVGGARAFTLEPFDAAIGIPDELGRRMARNTHIILQEESHIARVIDPAGGSGYVEHRTDALAAAAWAVLQEVEGQGGLAEALRSGWVHERLAKTRAHRQEALDRRKRPITGISEFPDPAEKPVVRERRDPAEVKAKAQARLALCRERVASIDPERISADRIGGLIEAAREGATLELLHRALVEHRQAEEIRTLPVIRLAERFEQIRDAVRAASAPPIYLANIGPLARHTARATFVQNLVGVAGFRVEHGPPTTDPAETVAAFGRSGAKVAFLCGADPDYAEHAAPFAEALKAAGAVRVLLAGRPGDLLDKLEAAGVEGHVALGMNVREALLGLLEAQGIPAPEGDDR